MGRKWLPGHSIDECELATLPQLVIDRILAPTTNCHEESSYSDRSTTSASSSKKINEDQEIYTDIAGHRSFIYCLCPQTLEEAIAATLPSGPGFRNQRLFAFVRHLKGMSDYRDCDASDLQPIVRQWHMQALPFIATREFEETWKDFLFAWDRVKCPVRGGPLAQIVQEALAEQIPVAANRYDDPDLKKLVTVCSKLQQLSGSEPFFLTCRDAANLLGGSAMQKTRWNSHMHRLCADGVLQLHSTGTRNRASEYFYKGGIS